MRFLFRLDLSLHAGAEKKIWNFEFGNQTRPLLDWLDGGALVGPVCHAAAIWTVSHGRRSAALPQRIFAPTREPFIPLLIDRGKKTAETFFLTKRQKLCR